MVPTPEEALRFHVELAREQWEESIEVFVGMRRSIGFHAPTPVEHVMRTQLAWWIMTIELLGFPPKPSGRPRGRFVWFLARDKYL